MYRQLRRQICRPALLPPRPLLLQSLGLWSWINYYTTSAMEAFSGCQDPVGALPHSHHRMAVEAVLSDRGLRCGAISAFP